MIGGNHKKNAGARYKECFNADVLEVLWNLEDAVGRLVTGS